MFKYLYNFVDPTPTKDSKWFWAMSSNRSLLGVWALWPLWRLCDVAKVSFGPSGMSVVPLLLALLALFQKVLFNPCLFGVTRQDKI
jgi:hypothetical protein